MRLAPRLSLLLFGLALPVSLFPATISSYSVYTDAQAGTSCAKSGTGPGSAACASNGGFDGTTQTSAGAAITDTALTLVGDSHHAGIASATASISHDDFYSVPVNGPIMVLESVQCRADHPFATGYFSLGSPLVTPAISSVWLPGTLAPGSGYCDVANRIAPVPPAFAVSLVAVNHLVELQTSISGQVYVGDNDSSLFVQLTVLGFQDAQGNAIPATLTPEPVASCTIALGLALIAALRRARH